MTSNNNNTNAVKTIYLIRHGVAAHNRSGVNYLDPKFTDSPLIERGRVQARLVGKRLCQMGLIIDGDGDNGDDGYDNDVTMKDQSSNSHQHTTSNNESSSVASDGGGGPIDLVICSPLARCMETAALIFPSYFANNNNDNAAAAAAAERSDESVDQQRRCRNSNYRNNDIMIPKTATTKEAGHHHTNNFNYKVICHGDVREAYGIHYSDKHGPISILKTRYPNVYYHQSSLSVDNDAQWQSNVRESRKDVEQRVRRFFHWLVLYLDQQQRTTSADTNNSIAIVTHGVWMECALLMYCPEVLNFGTMRVHNCDVYVARLVGVTTTTTTTLLGGEDETAEAADSLSLENNQSGNTLMVRLQDAKKLISIV